MVKIGMLIADRYEVLEKIGTGGMSDVYKGKDHKLNRYVAIKVLKQEFYENANFVSKFRMEAQVSAGLMHPNIVNVYDVGEEKGLFYIIMELVDGITLKKYIEKKARLSVREAISIAIQVSMGLQAAHNAHIIHRDIKPQNIMISKDGKVKVTDFGIAKAATSNTITSNVMGSVHYTSPEQARGGYSDEKSDIYSLGITLFEMLTGRVPFNGETTVAIAIKQIQQPMPSPCEFVPEIPHSVEQIVLKCCEKSPDRRYQNMGELIDDLKRSLVDPDGDFVRRIDPDTDGATRMVTPGDRGSMRRQYQGTANSGTNQSPEDRDGERFAGEAEASETTAERYTAVRGRENVRGRDRGRQDDGRLRLERDERRRYEEDDYEDDYAEDVSGGRKTEHLTTLVAVLAAVIIGIIVIFLAGRALGLWGGVSESAIENATAVSMPNVVGKDEASAKSSLTALGLDPQVTYEKSDKEAGTVLEQSIDAGKTVTPGTTVSLTVAASSEGIEVPNVVGISKQEARVQLEKKNFVVNVQEQSSDSVDSGKVISQSPEAGTSAASGSSVTITVSSGPDKSGQVQVPTLTGITQDEAQKLIEEAGLKLGKVTEVTNSDANLTGKVCSQSIDAGEYVDSGTAVDLEVSTGVGTYYYSGEIDAPTQAEDPNYTAGTAVQCTITDANGTQLYNQTVSGFPQPVGLTQITTATGTLTMAYYDTVPESTTTDENGNTVTTPASSNLVMFTRPLTFTAQQ